MKLRSENGAVVIEATLSLTFFMFAMITLYSMFNVSLAQARISAALNSTAKELSQYSYVYAMTGANDAQSNIASQGGAAASIMSDELAEVNGVFDALGSLSNATTEVLGDPGNSESFLYYILNEGIDQVKAAVTGELSRNLMKKHLGNDADGFLKGVGIEDGLSGLKFHKTRIFEGGSSDEILLNVRYSVTVVKLLDIDMKMNFELCAKTRAWVGQ